MHLPQETSQPQKGTEETSASLSATVVVALPLLPVAVPVPLLPVAHRRDRKKSRSSLTN